LQKVNQNKPVGSMISVVGNNHTTVLRHSQLPQTAWGAACQRTALHPASGKGFSPDSGSVVVQPYRTRISGQTVARCSAHGGRSETRGLRIEWAEVAIILDQPFGVVAGGEGADSLAGLGDCLEDTVVDDPLLYRLDEFLHEAIRFQFGHECVDWRYPTESDLVREFIGDEVAAVVVTEREAAGGALSEMAELLVEGQGEHLSDLEAGAALRRVSAQDLSATVFRDAEGPDLDMLHGGDPGCVGRSHDVWRGGDDLLLVAGLVPAAGTMGREQSVLTHHAEEPLSGDALDGPGELAVGGLRLPLLGAPSALWRHRSNLKVGTPILRARSSNRLPLNGRRMTSRLRSAVQYMAGGKGPTFVGARPRASRSRASFPVWSALGQWIAWVGCACPCYPLAHQRPKDLRSASWWTSSFRSLLDKWESSENGCSSLADTLARRHNDLDTIISYRQAESLVECSARDI
jgi:hypothetical protein